MFNIEEVKGLLLKICVDNIGEFSEEMQKKRHIFWSDEDINLILNYKDLDLLDETIEKIRSEDTVKTNFSVPYIKDKLKNIIVEAFKSDEDERESIIQENLENLRSELKSEITDWTFLVPVMNLIVEDKFIIGDVELLNFDSISDKLLESFKDWGDDQKDIMAEYYFPHSTGKTYAKVNVRGVKNYAKFLALHKIRLALGILSLYKYPKELPFAIEGELKAPISRVLYVCSKNKGRSLSMESVGVGGYMALDSKRIEKVLNNDFKKFSEMLSNPSPNEFETRLLTAIYWFNEAASVEIQEKDRIFEKKKKKHQNLEYFKLGESFLKLFTALESILIFSDEPITENIAERSAMLLGDNYKEKMNIKKMIKRLYNTRSIITHQGNVFVSIHDLNGLKQIVKALIFVLIEMKDQHELKSAHDLKSLIDKMKYGGISKDKENN